MYFHVNCSLMIVVLFTDNIHDDDGRIGSRGITKMSFMHDWSTRFFFNWSLRDKRGAFIFLKHVSVGRSVFLLLLFRMPCGCNDWLLPPLTTALCCTGCTYTLRASGFPAPCCCRLSSQRSFLLHGKALVVKSRGQTSKCSVLTVRLGHSLHFAVPSFSPSSAPIMQAFAPVVGFSLPGTPGTKPVENGGRLPSVQL